VYVFEDVTGGYTCCSCPFGERWLNVPSRAQMISHLESHVTAGHKVPAYAMDELRGEMEGIVGRNAASRDAEGAQLRQAQAFDRLESEAASAGRVPFRMLGGEG
jgi:hypothetical protein